MMMVLISDRGFDCEIVNLVKSGEHSIKRNPGSQFLLYRSGNSRQEGCLGGGSEVPLECSAEVTTRNRLSRISGDWIFSSLEIYGAFFLMLEIFRGLMGLFI